MSENEKPDAPGPDEQSDTILTVIADSLDLARCVYDRVTHPSMSLANKYLYLGSHGAQAWSEVEKYGQYKVKTQGRNALSENIGKILEAIKADGVKGPLDIVSLGTGTGADDTLIVGKVEDVFPHGRVNWFGVDLSVDLLRAGTAHLKSALRDTPYMKRTAVRSICVDIEELPEYADHLFFPRGGNETRLYHLLGLTLGNNRETQFMRHIAQCMSCGDYLLVAVDFWDQNEWKTESIRSYFDSWNPISKFLAGPLQTAIEACVPGEHQVCFSGHWCGQCSQDRYDYLAMESVIIQPVTLQGGDAKQVCDVGEGISLARYYLTPDLPEALRSQPRSPEFKRMSKLCDFSNKYYCSHFKTWLARESGVTGLRLVEPVERWRSGGQHLVLLKRVPQDQPPGRDRAAVKELADYIEGTFLPECIEFYEGKPLADECSDLAKIMRDSLNVHPVDRLMGVGDEEFKTLKTVPMYDDEDMVPEFLLKLRRVLRADDTGKTEG